MMKMEAKNSAVIVKMNGMKATSIRQIVLM